MTAVEYLNQVSKLENEIKRLSWRIQHTRERITDLNLSYGSDQVQTSKTDMDPAYAKALQEVIVLEEKANTLEIELHQVTEQVITTINKLEDIEANVLTLRYINGYDFYKIARNIGYSYEGTRDIHQRAIKQLEEFI